MAKVQQSEGTHALLLKLSADDWRQIREAAEANGTSASALIREAVRMALDGEGYIPPEAFTAAMRKLSRRFGFQEVVFLEIADKALEEAMSTS